MNLTKGHNNLTMLNEITKLHMWNVFKDINIWLW